MHELAIAESIVDMAEETAAGAGARRVTSIHLRLGALSSVVEEALRFSFQLAATGTAVEGAQLDVQKVPLAIFCRPCSAERDLVTPNFSCPVCGTPSAEVVRGRELEVTSVEIADG